MRDERGSGTVLVLGIASVLLLLGFTATALGAVAVARHRASSAADLAALAVAARVPEGATAACAAGRRAVAAVGADLVSCRLAGPVAEVVAVVRPPGWLGTVGGSTGRARAGPVGAATSSRRASRTAIWNGPGGRSR